MKLPYQSGQFRRFGGQSFQERPSFRAPYGRRRNPVKGGRWQVRRVDIRSKKPWRAWTSGSAAPFNRRFATQAEAVQWAQRVPWVLANGNPSELTALIVTRFPNIGAEHYYKLLTGFGGVSRNRKDKR